jgi:hypothetical protein
MFILADCTELYGDGYGYIKQMKINAQYIDIFTVRHCSLYVLIICYSTFGRVYELSGSLRREEQGGRKCTRVFEQEAATEKI